KHNHMLYPSTPAITLWTIPSLKLDAINLCNAPLDRNQVEIRRRRNKAIHYTLIPKHCPNKKNYYEGNCFFIRKSTFPPEFYLFIINGLLKVDDSLRNNFKLEIAAMTGKKNEYNFALTYVKKLP